MKSWLGYSAIAILLVTGSSPTQAWAQEQPAAGSVSNGQQAVSVVLANYAINPTIINPKTSKPLTTNGSWSVSKSVPAACSETPERCMQVFYQVPAEEILCSWTLLVDLDGKKGRFLDENDDARRYLLQRLAADEAQAFVADRKKPTYPPIAMAAHVQGEVIVTVIVSPAGDVQSIESAVGPEMLKASGVDAARKWKFKPFPVGGAPISYDAKLSFTFRTKGPGSVSTIDVKP